jgi:lipopolysaccharide transport protein LptA
VLRLRIFRILLPLLLLFLGVLLWKSCDPNIGSAHRVPLDGGVPDVARAEGLSFAEFSEGSRDALRGKAEVFEPHDDGSLHLEGIRELEIQREKRGPLIVSAQLGDREGKEGETHWHFENDVEFYEPEQGLRLSLPVLEYDEAAGEARSSGDIRFQTSNLKGRTTSLLYGLDGQAGEMLELELRDEQGGLLTADRARLLDGMRDVELVGHVRITRPAQQLRAGQARLIQGPERRLRQAVITQEVSGEWSEADGGPGSFRGDRLELRWDGGGAVEFLRISGDALVTLAENSLAASTIEAARQGAGQEWKVHAAQRVYVQGRFGGAPGLLRAEELQGTLDASLNLRDAEARGRVSFEGRGTRAEAERATFAVDLISGGQIQLFGDDLRKARLAQDNIRVSAKEIRTDVRGNRLAAREQVEATLLPGEQDASAITRMRLFAAEQAIHFVSEALDSEDKGARLTFTGSVRGWQGERNLAAESIVLDQENATLEADGAVTTRIPRESGTALLEADYLQIAANHLSYDDRQGRAVYEGQVRVRMFEGWLEAERVEVDLAVENRSIREIRAYESVQVEFHRTSEGQLARPLSGTADRLVYAPLEMTIRLLGDRVPASVRRIGQGGGTTTGRVLRYRLDTGTLDVESGEQGPGRIRS